MEVLKSKILSESFTSLEIVPYKIVSQIICRDDEFKKQNDARTRELLNKKFRFDNETEHIELDKIYPFDDEYVTFNPYTEYEHDMLSESIEKYGLFSPIILWKFPTGFYYILSGLERYKCFLELYIEGCEANDESKMNLYMKIPSFVIEYDAIDDLRARDIMVDANLCVRKMDPMSFSNAIANKMAIKYADKKLRNDLNVMEEISQEMMRSKPTLYGYRKLQNLTKSGAYLLQKKQINLKSAIKLAGFSPEIQLAFINYIGMDNVNDLKISVFNPGESTTDQSLKGALQIAKNCEHSFYTKIIIKCPMKRVKDVKEKIDEVMKRIPKDWLVKTKYPKITV